VGSSVGVYAANVVSAVVAECDLGLAVAAQRAEGARVGGRATLAVVVVAKQRASLAEPGETARMAAGELVAVARPTTGSDRFPGVGRGAMGAGWSGRGEGELAGDQPGLCGVWAE
jgi:hypothetical protein